MLISILTWGNNHIPTTTLFPMIVPRGSPVILPPETWTTHLSPIDERTPTLMLWISPYWNIRTIDVDQEEKTQDLMIKSTSEDGTIPNSRIYSKLYTSNNARGGCNPYSLIDNRLPVSKIDHLPMSTPWMICQLHLQRIDSPSNIKTHSCWLFQ